MVPVSEDTIRRALEACNGFPNLADLLLPGIDFFDNVDVQKYKSDWRRRYCLENKR
jgi:hypothetical protein